jgi:hypothetical protein
MGFRADERDAWQRARWERVGKKLAAFVGFEMLDSISGANIGEGGVVCLSQDLLPLTGKHKIIPLWAI